jgi:hypothetical protein
MPSGQVDRDQYLDNWAGGLAIARLVRRTDPRPYHARQRLMRRMTRSVVRPSQGSITNSNLNLRTTGMSLSTFGSRLKKRCRFRKRCEKPSKLRMRKSVAAIRKAGRAAGLRFPIPTREVGTNFAIVILRRSPQPPRRREAFDRAPLR